MNSSEKIVIDFLGIGAQKSATSWLWQNLRDHPDIWVPPRKELHYFDRSLHYPSPGFLATDIYKDRLKGAEKHNIQFREKMNHELRLAKASGKKDDIEWFENYFYGDVSDEWYRSLFVQGEGKIKGEITPAYSILSIEDIQRVKELSPNVKLIFLVRNPIERAWSHLRFLIKTGRLNKYITVEESIKFIDSPFQTLRGAYIDILTRWQSIFPASQFFIGYYDEVIKNPKELLTRLFVFLNLKPEKSSFLSLYAKRNISPSIQIPKEIKSYLVKKYFKDIKKLASLYPSSYPSKWLNQYGY